MKVKKEIASLTKMMTAYTCICLCKKWELNPTEIMVEVPKRCEKIIGTTASLKEGTTLSVWDLLHGVMLPSGNDAAFLLAMHFGFEIQKRGEELDHTSQFIHPKSQFFMTPGVKIFLRQMNANAMRFGLLNTFYDSPHGLANKYNKSTAED